MLEGSELGWKMPRRPRRQNPADPGVGKREQGGCWEQGGNASPPGEQSWAQPSDTTSSPRKTDGKIKWKNPTGSHPVLAMATVTPFLFSSRPSWPGGNLPPVPQRPTGKTGETLRPSDPKKEGCGGHHHTLPFPQVLPHARALLGAWYSLGPRRGSSPTLGFWGYLGILVFGMTSVLCPVPWMLGCTVVGLGCSRVPLKGWQS